MSFEWFGAAFDAKALRALQLGIDKTTSEGTKIAKDLVHVDTATLQGSIRSDPAKIIGNEVVGQYGSHAVNYAEPQEFLPPERGGKPYLRPSETEARKRMLPNIDEAWRNLP